MSNNLKKEKNLPVEPSLMEEADVVEMNEILRRGEESAVRVVEGMKKGKKRMGIWYSRVPNPPTDEGME